MDRLSFERAAAVTRLEESSDILIPSKLAVALAESRSEVCVLYESGGCGGGACGGGGCNVHGVATVVEEGWADVESPEAVGGPRGAVLGVEVGHA